MSYTVLRVTEAGVVLYEQHRQRFLRGGAAAAAAFEAFAARAEPGIFRVSWAADQLQIERRETTSLFDGIPVRYLPTPLGGDAGSVEKTPAPNGYSSVRQPGIATLLTSPDGQEIYESCTAAVVEYEDGFIVSPADRPRLRSTTLQLLSGAVPVREAPLRRDSHRPLALINAVTGLIVPGIADRAPFPAEARAFFDRLLRASTRRP